MRDKSILKDQEEYFIGGIQHRNTNPNTTIQNIWKNYNIFAAIHNISTAWNQVKSDTINACWKNVCPTYFMYDEEPDNTHDKITNVIEECTSLADILQIELDTQEISTLIFNQGEPLTNNELIQMQTLEVLDEYNDEYDEENLETHTKMFSFKKWRLPLKT